MRLNVASIGCVAGSNWLLVKYCPGTRPVWAAPKGTLKCFTCDTSRTCAALGKSLSIQTAASNDVALPTRSTIFTMTGQNNSPVSGCSVSPATVFSVTKCVYLKKYWFLISPMDSKGASSSEQVKVNSGDVPKASEVDISTTTWVPSLALVTCGKGLSAPGSYRTIAAP